MTAPPMAGLPAGALPPNSTIGILGGGQLGRMSALAAARLGYRVHIFCPEPESPAAAVAAAHTIAEYEDHAALAGFARAVDVVTFEFENVSVAGLDALAAVTPVRPGPSILRLTQDRVTEKSFVNGAGIATASWAPANDAAELAAACAHMGYPCVVKTCRMGYDGRGQMVVRGPDDAARAWERLGEAPLIVEEFVDFAMEVSVIVARGLDGAVSCFDAVENRHRNHILDLTLAPARIGADLAAAALSIARRLAAAMDLVGLLAVEMFVSREGELLVNEMAPRPHNSGHWTIDACPASQFELHIRAVAGLPLPSTHRHSDAVMKNLVGPAELALWPAALSAPGLIPHLYGKAEAREGRKMGHVTHLFPRGALPGELGVAAALGPLAPPDIA